MTLIVFDEYAVNLMVRIAESKGRNAPEQRIASMEANLRDRIDTLKERGHWKELRDRIIDETTTQEAA